MGLHTKWFKESHTWTRASFGRATWLFPNSALYSRVWNNINGFQKLLSSVLKSWRQGTGHVHPMDGLYVWMDQTRGENELCLLHLPSSHKHHREERLLSACRREEARASQSAIVPSAPRRTPRRPQKRREPPMFQLTPRIMHCSWMVRFLGASLWNWNTLGISEFPLRTYRLYK